MSALQRYFYRRQVASRRIVAHLQGKTPLHFLHIGKTGGSAIQYALRDLASMSQFAPFFHPHHMRLCDLHKGDPVIFFLRNPISRFISGFYSRQRQGRPRYHYPWSAVEQDAFAHFHTPNALALALTSPNQEQQQRAQMAMQGIQHVRDSYWDWFGDAAYLRARAADIAFIGHQETLAEDFERLKARLGLPTALALPTDQSIAHKAPVDLDRRLEPKALANLNAWYRQDFEFVALCQDAYDQDAYDQATYEKRVSLPRKVTP